MIFLLTCVCLSLPCPTDKSMFAQMSHFMEPLQTPIIHFPCTSFLFICHSSHKNSMVYWVLWKFPLVYGFWKSRHHTTASLLFLTSYHRVCNYTIYSINFSKFNFVQKECIRQIEYFSYPNNQTNTTYKILIRKITLRACTTKCVIFISVN